MILVQLPANHGNACNSRSQAIYQKLAGSYGVILCRFILVDIADKFELMQSNGIHSKAEGADNYVKQCQTQPGKADHRTKVNTQRA